MKLRLWIAAGCGLITYYSVALASPDDYRGTLDLQAQSSFSRLSISLDDSFRPKIKEVPGGFELFIPAASLMDIGVPYGGEKEFNNHLLNIQDQRIKKLSVHEKEEGLVIRGTYSYPVGKDALANPAMEHFDFNQKEHGKYVIDFWYKKGPTIVEANLLKKQLALKKAKDEENALIKREAEKKALRAKRMEESRNALRFCELPFDRNSTLWVKYRAEHPIINFNAYFPELVPDHRFEYHEPKGNNEEEQMVKLALKLSRENKHALVVKTVEFLQKEYPKSKFLTEMEFLKASSFYRLELFDQGKAVIIDLSKKAKGTEVGLQATAFLAVHAFRKQEWLSAFEAFMSIRKTMPNHPLNWLFRYASAECLYQIRQSDQAKAEWEWLAKNAPKAQIRAEVTFKIGDLNFARNQFAEAIQAYSSAIKKNEEGANQYPVVFMNLAESYFQLDEYEKAEEYFLKYIAAARGQPQAWKASLRIAEIRSIKHPKDLEKNFTETINQYPLTPGAVIARLRMLPCGNHGGFDLAGAERYLASDEVKNAEAPDSFYSTTMKELIGLTEVRTLLSFAQDEKSVQKGLVQLRENPSVVARKMVESAMVGGVKRMLEKELNANNLYGAIAIYEKYGDYLPPPTFDPLTDQMRLRIARFAADQKLSSMALKIIEPYRIGDEAELKNIANEIQKTIFLTSNSEQEERAFVEAKSLWNGEKFDAKNEKKSAEFLEKLSIVRDQSRLAFERDLLKSLYLREAGEDEKSLELGKTLISRMSRLKPYTVAQTWIFLAETAKKSNELAFAAKAYREARMKAEKLTEHDKSDFEYRQFPAVPTISYLYTSEGEILERQQKWKEAVALYTEAIENKIGGNHVLYAHSRALLKEGGREAKLIASRSLEKIKQSQDDDVWKTLAQKALDDIAKEGKDDQNR